MNNKTTRRALLGSVLAMLLCFTMLLSTTFAWFTDTAVSASNKIVAGSLKIDLEVLGDSGFESIKESKAPLFNYDKWEPGYTEFKVLKVENEGTLALKWYATFSSTTALSELADVIDVFVCPSADPIAAPTGRDLTGYTKAGTLREFVNTLETTTNGVLYAQGETGSVAYLGIALKMREEAGNEYQSLDLGGAFDILVAATQLNHESDSFDNTYDEGLTPPDFDGDIMAEIDGLTYAYNEDGSARLYLVPEEYTGDTVEVAEGIDTIGNYAFAYNTNVKTVVLPSSIKTLGRGFDSSTVEKVVLNEGLEQIDSRAFRSTTALEEVVIPSTVKVIADNSFQKSGIKEITIPATVETIGETAFGSSAIETVTIEGNTSIQGYAFRGCANLRTVYLNGDDVTFIASTLNGRNSTWFCNGESNNPNTSNITFYVKNDTVAERVRAAMGAEAGNTTIIVQP